MAPVTQQQQQQPQQATTTSVSPSTPPPSLNAPQHQPQQVEQAPFTAGSRKPSWAAVARVDTQLRTRSSEGGQQQKQSIEPPTTAPLSPSTPSPTGKPSWANVAKAITHAPTLNAQIVRRRMQQQQQINSWAAPQQHPRLRASSLSASVSTASRTSTPTPARATTNNNEEARASKSKAALAVTPALPAPAPTAEPKPASGVLLQCVAPSAKQHCVEYLAKTIAGRADVDEFKKLTCLTGDWWMAPCIDPMFAELVMAECEESAPQELRAAVVTDPLLYNTLTDKEANIDKRALNANLWKLKFVHGPAQASSSVQADQWPHPPTWAPPQPWLSQGARGRQGTHQEVHAHHKPGVGPEQCPRPSLEQQ